MAQIAVSQTAKVTKIDKFLGLNLSNTGDTQIQLGESGNMDNFFITNDLKLRKMSGYKTFYDFGTYIRGIYSTNLGGTEYLLVATDGKLYYFLKSELEAEWENIAVDDDPDDDVTPDPVYGVNPHLIGNIGTGDVSFFTFDKKVYILSGKYHSWDGTTLTEVAGYTPLVFINTPPAGGGILYDEINILSPKKHQTFNGDGSSKTFHLAQNYAVSGVNLASIDKVVVNGSTVASTGYSYDLAAGTVTINSAPSSGMDNVDIYWTLNDGDRGIIEGMKFGTVFGGAIDSRVFLYGNSSMPNRTYFSGINSETGQPSVEYFPASAFVDVGPSNFALTDLTRQYDRLLATTNRPEAYYLTIGTETLPLTLSDNSTTSRLVPSVSTYPLNEVHGNVAPGQGQLIDNYPVTLDRNALILWKATNVRDEKNMEDISQKIKLDLNELDLKAFKTMDFQKENQLWFGSNNRIYIYNYFNKTYSRIKIPTDFSEYSALGNSVYMAMLDGKMVKWGDEFQTFDGTDIRAHWEMNFSDFNAAHLRKTMNRLWVLMQPQSNSSADIGFITNKAESPSKKTIRYKIQFFNDVDFSDFSFGISNNPQPFRLKMKAKKFTNLKITIDNNDDTDCTILQLVLKVDSFGESK